MQHFEGFVSLDTENKKHIKDYIALASQPIKLMSSNSMEGQWCIQKLLNEARITVSTCNLGHSGRHSNKKSSSFKLTCLFSGTTTVFVGASAEFDLYWIRHLNNKFDEGLSSEIKI